MHAPAATPDHRFGGDLERRARGGAVAASPWIEGLGRFGYAAKGLVYLIVGGLAVQAALGEDGGTTTDQSGALAHVASAPFGKSLLVVIAVGLIGYALWKMVLGILDTERKGTGWKGLLTRGVNVGVGFIYLGLAYSAMRIAMGDGSVQGSSQQTQDWTARLMNQPFGTWLVILAGLVVIGNGLFQLYRAVKMDLCDDLDCSQMRGDQETWVERIGRAGYAARGVAFMTIGGLLVAAALHHNPSEAQGLDGALATLASQPFGPYILLLVAAGLAAYGIYALVEARYRKMVVR
jgi:hypothetical protein